MQKAILEGIRLSPQQKYLWLLQREEQKQPYRTQCAILIEGNLNKIILKTALENVVKRHELLRTTFNRLSGMDIPIQVIGDASSFTNSEWIEHNLTDCNPEQQTAKIEEIFNQLSQLPFNFEQGPLFYVSLVTLSAEKYLLIVSLPAMIADTTTLKNLVHEISCSYTACLQGKEIDDELLQYADIAEWQNELLEGEDTEVGREYWRQRDIFNLLNFNLPLENDREVKSEFQPQFFSLTINYEKIAELANGRNYETFLLACWQVLLWRLTEQSGVAIATAYDGRQYEELEPAIGLFTKYLPLDCHLQENCKFSEILEQVTESHREIYKWQESFSWEQLVATNDPSKQAIFFPFCFDFESVSASEKSVDISFSIFQQYTCINRFKVNLSCIQKEDSLRLEFHYDANLFSFEYIRHLAGQFHTLLLNALTKPEALISELEIIEPRELDKLLFEFNNTKVEHSKFQCIHHIFEKQVEQTPNNIAVVYDGQQLTYAELNNYANQLAHYLQKLGVKPETLVGLCVERSLEMAIGILGILKAGGAYLPLDPLYPKERLAFMLEDSQTPVLLTQQRLVEGLPYHTAKTVCLDTDWKVIAQENDKNPQSAVKTENLAYIIYTSGSTGKPKGVLINHKNLVHSTNARITYYQEPVTSFLLLSSFAFDSSVGPIFWTLCQGGILVLPEDNLQRDIKKVVELIARNRVSHLLSLPSLYTLLLEQAKSEQLASLHTVIVAGEPCTKNLVANHLELLSETSLFNEYGPTEGTVWSSVYNCHSSELRTQIPIGRPIANTQIYLLDSHLHPVPIGVAGELYISGDGVARGYLNRPDLTTEKFIPNPFSDRSESRLYKTGDLARYLLDGNIEFLGRIDRQVKIRGFRIELGEIEAMLSQHPGVQAIAVTAREDEPDRKRLVAYIVPRQGESLSTTDLRHFLQNRLPEYMMPSAFVYLKALPHLPNGKVDIKALPAPEIVRSELSGAFVAPQTPVEKILAEIWTELLRVEQVGIHDNFFELGGDSILSIQIVARANQAGLQLTPKQLFDCQTIAELAVVASTIQTQPEQELVTEQASFTPLPHESTEAKDYTPNDFPQANLSQKDLDLFLAKINQ